MDKILRQAIVKSLKDGNPNIRRGAAIAAGEEQIKEAGPALAALLKDPQWRVRQAAAVALGALGDTRATPFLRKIIGAEGRNDRMRIITILGKKAKDTAEAREALNQIWGDDFKEKEGNLTVLRAAAWALGQIMHAIVIDPLVEILGRSDAGQIIAALSGLATLGVSEASNEIIACLKHDRWEIRQAAAIALGKIRALGAAKALMESVEDPRWEVRMEVVIALNHLKDERAREIFIKALGDERAEVRRTAAIALGNMRDETALPPLVGALEDKNWMVRKAILSALGNIHSDKAKEDILKCLLDEDDEVRQEAALAYGRCVQPRVTG